VEAPEGTAARNRPTWMTMMYGIKSDRDLIWATFRGMKVNLHGGIASGIEDLRI